MGEAFDRLKNALRKLPGLGLKGSERMALHLVLEGRGEAADIAQAINAALEVVTPCPKCFGLSENGLACRICSDPSRDASMLCVVERAGDIDAVEKSGAWRGRYHVLGGKLSPMRKVGPDNLRLDELAQKVSGGGISEIMLALSNDAEGEATCYYIQERIVGGRDIKLTRIGFGLPSGSQLGFADSGTIRSALDSRKPF